MNRRISVAVMTAAGIFAASDAADVARADHQPFIAVPGNWQVPVIVNGADASYRAVVGDWGLHAPSQVNPHVYGYGFDAAHPRRGYFPSAGRNPRYGRQEVEPLRRVEPLPVPSFYRAWSVQSGFDAPIGYPAGDPPPVIMAPRMDSQEYSPRPPR